MAQNDKMDFVPDSCGRFISRGKGSHPVRRISTNEIIYCVKGILRIFEEENSFELHPGDYCILRKNRRHGGIGKYPPGLSFFWLHFDCREEVFEEIPPAGHCARPEQIALYLQSYLTERTLSSPDTETQKLLLQLILRELKRSTLQEKSVSALLQKAAVFIKLNFAKPVTVKNAAAELKCSSEYLGRIFHRHFKETFSAYLNRIRAEHGAKLLLETNMSVKEIITECGFNDPAYFRRIFYSRYASTPGRFRKFHSGGHHNTE